MNSTSFCYLLNALIFLGTESVRGSLWHKQRWFMLQPWHCIFSEIKFGMKYATEWNVKWKEMWHETNFHSIFQTNKYNYTSFNQLALIQLMAIFKAYVLWVVLLLSVLCRFIFLYCSYSGEFFNVFLSHPSSSCNQFIQVQQWQSGRGPIISRQQRRHCLWE